MSNPLHTLTLNLRLISTASLRQQATASRSPIRALQFQLRCRSTQSRSRDPQLGTSTPLPEGHTPTAPAESSRFYFETGYAGWAKRLSRPFPPPFFSPPSGSFSDPLSTHNRASYVDGELIRGVTVGDDALLASPRFVGANDGVGAWAQKERGHAPLWSRLIIHFWALEAEKNSGNDVEPDPVSWLDNAYFLTKETLSGVDEWLGTTTASSAFLHWQDDTPVIYITQVGDSKVMLVRPTGTPISRESDLTPQVLFETTEQWHYFDCPRQLGTNSPDTPRTNAVLTKITIHPDDIILAMSDGVTDNLWPEEISQITVESLAHWRKSCISTLNASPDNDCHVVLEETLAEGMKYVAQEIVLAARKVAEDPFAASPFMERAVEEGLAIEGGKLDDISAVAAICRERKPQ